MEPDLKEQEQKLIDQLTIIKNAFIKNQQDLKFSIRKDIVAAQLKDLLENNPNFYELKSALETYIDNLLKIDNIGE
jgi:hypothetical protein